MALNINHNLMANTVLMNLGTTYTQLAESINKLSSGLRINSADDDAAGLAVRELMRAEIAALGQGVRNANDGISMLQTFDGAAQTIDEMLIRSKELAEQAATGTYSDTQRTMMQGEFAALRSEITRIANSTDFNGIQGLNSSGTVVIHFGSGASSAEDYYSVSQYNLTSSTLGLDALNVASQASARAALTGINTAIGTKDAARAHFGAMMNRLGNTIANIEIQKENLQAAEAQISDVDVAAEMTRLTRNQVLAQAGVSMLVQANSMPMLALKLLG